VKDVKIPTTAAELEALLNDPKRFAEALEAGRGAEVVKAYTRSQLREDMEVTLTELAAEHGVRRPPLGTPGNGHDRQILNRQLGAWSGAPGHRADGIFGSLGEFVRSISPEALKTGGLRNDYSSIEPSAGGFLLPETFRAELLSIALGEAIVRPRATVLPMTTSKLAVPVVDETSRASSVFGGLSASWTEEGAALPESEARFGRVVLQAAKLASSCDVPNELLADSSPAIDVVLAAMFGSALAFYEDLAFLTGTGAGEPLGVLNSAACITQDKETGQTADTVVLENITKMYSRLFPRSKRRAVWLCSPDVTPELHTLAVPVGVGGAPYPAFRETDGEYRLLGLPLFECEYLPKLGDEGDLLLADLAYYLVGDRAEMRFQASEHVKFTQDMTVYRAIERADGRPWLLSAIEPQNAGPTLSAFVKLAERD
jgi:HK97 family phage major capsid protein